MPTGFIWRGLSEAEAYTIFIMALPDLQTFW
jgi:hypothetical protein